VVTVVHKSEELTDCGTESLRR